MPENGGVRAPSERRHEGRRRTAEAASHRGEPMPENGGGRGPSGGGHDGRGLPWGEIFPKYRIVGVPIVETGARFASPVRYGDQVRIRSTVTEVKDKTFRVEHEVSVGDRQCATGFEVRAWVARPDDPGARLT